MPELPEVETVRRGLAPVMQDAVFENVDVRRPDLRWPFPAGMARSIQGQRVLALRRRSKYLLIDLSNDMTVILHLGMSGRLLISGAVIGGFHHTRRAPEKHDHVIFDMDNGARVAFNDARRFGAIDLVPTAAVAAHKLLRNLGPEPLGNAFNAAVLASRLKGRKTPIKSALLDQKVVAGLGNIYVCESLFRSGISPLRHAGAISEKRIEGLTNAIRTVLEEAIDAGGSSLKDYRRADGELGYFQHSFLVYDREDQPCRTKGCKGTIRRVTQSGRSTYYCPICQR